MGNRAEVNAADEPKVPNCPQCAKTIDGGRTPHMEEQVAFYFGSVAEGLIVLAISIISGAALTNGYSVLKNHHQRSYRSRDRSDSWDSLAPWLVIAVAVSLA